MPVDAMNDCRYASINGNEDLGRGFHRYPRARKPLGNRERIAGPEFDASAVTVHHGDLAGQDRTHFGVSPGTDRDKARRARPENGYHALRRAIHVLILSFGPGW